MMTYYIFGFLHVWKYFALVTILFSFLVMCSSYNIFEKVKKRGKLCFIPIYNLLVMLDVVEMSKLNFIFMLLPVVNIFVILLIMYRLSIVFHTSTAFAIGLILFPVLFLPLLSFSGYLHTEEETEKKDDVTPEMIQMMTEKQFHELNKVVDDTPKVDNVFKAEIKEIPPAPAFRANRIKYQEMIKEEVVPKEEKIERVEPVQVKDLYANRFINSKVTEEDDSIEIVEL